MCVTRTLQLQKVMAGGSPQREGGGGRSLVLMALLGILLGYVYLWAKKQLQ